MLLPRTPALGNAAAKIKHPCRVLLCGRSGLGKTTLSQSIIVQRLLPFVYDVYIACPTFWEQHQLSELRRSKKIKKENVYTDVTENTFIEIYEKILKNGKRQAILYVDDAAAERCTNVGSKGPFARLCIASPHLNLSIIGCFQRITSATVGLRDNCEAFISFVPTKSHDVDTIIEEYNPTPSLNGSANKLGAILNSLWKKYRFVFIHRPIFVGNINFYGEFRDLINFH